MVYNSALSIFLLYLVVGRESILAVAGIREARCGRRLVSGLFSRPRLPLGYSYVTTVPTGACRLNVTELVPSDNYIALKISNGSYIMNGEFAISAPGTYEAAGARFMYSRAIGLDSVFAVGPILHPIDIMILYTQPNPSIKYEYFTESLPGDLEAESITKSNIPVIEPTTTGKHNRRHHGLDAYPRSTAGILKHIEHSKEFKSDEDIKENTIGTRTFIWKILSYSQCTRTCGGGIQIGKYRCVETSANGADREISPVHCEGSPPTARRRRCGVMPCPPRWRAAAWSSCPRCGPAIRTRIVGCVQDHSRGITKVSDQKCLTPKPVMTEPCDIPDCDEVRFGQSKQTERKRIIRPREHVAQVTDNFDEGPVYTVSLNSSDIDIGPEYSFSAAAGWLYTEWSQCVGWCVGGGIQTRGIKCADPSGCTPRKSPESTRTCSPQLTCDPHNGQWFTGDWSTCSSPCDGQQVRGVLCIGGSGRHLRDSACKGPRPEHQRNCEVQCSPSWFYSDWGKCIGNCSSGTGKQRRTVWCSRGGTGASVADTECGLPKPHAHQHCSPLCTAIATIPPDLAIESQRLSGNENTSSSTQRISTTTVETEIRDCEDKLTNCELAVQARLCGYNYYVQNCCYSCKGR